MFQNRASAWLYYVILMDPTTQFQWGLCWSQEICLDLVNEHSNLHGVRMHNPTHSSFNISIECPSESLLELGPPHMR
jgi:hypothetical protein